MELLGGDAQTSEFEGPLTRNQRFQGSRRTFFEGFWERSSCTGPVSVAGGCSCEQNGFPGAQEGTAGGSQAPRRGQLEAPTAKSSKLVGQVLPLFNIDMDVFI